MATTIQQAGRHVPLERIRVPENVRALDEAHVEALAGSIKLQGMLVPLVVREGADGFELVAGFHRIAAARSLGLAEVPVVVRDADTEDADRAVENITRKQLNPYEEAKAVRAMLDRPLTVDDAAQALGWPKARVTARVKLLELPERAQQLIGGGVIPLSAVDQLRAIGAVAPKLLRAVIAYLDDATDVTKTRKDGSRGRLHYDYGDHRDPQAAIAWLWKFIDAAKTAGELYGRALVVIAAEQYATRLVLPASQRMPATRWSSHTDIAAKALRKLAGPHVPASLTKLEQAVKRAHTAYDKAERNARKRQQTCEASSPAREIPSLERTVGRGRTSIAIPSWTAATLTRVSRATRGAVSW
jgi:ParB/RepB/Spo0J family partition protein